MQLGTMQPTIASTSRPTAAHIPSSPLQLQNAQIPVQAVQESQGEGKGRPYNTHHSIIYRLIYVSRYPHNPEQVP